MQSRFSADGFPIVVAVLLPFLLAVTPALAQHTARDSRLAWPASHLDQNDDAPILLTGHLGLGGSFQYDHIQPDYGVSLIFRPGAAARFIAPAARWNTAMVLRLDRQRLAGGSRLLSGDLLLRHYFPDRGPAEAEVMPFFGLGLGASDVVLAADVAGSSSRYWSYVAEAGQEWFFDSRLVVVARFQYRLFNHGDLVISALAVSAAVGIPVPW